MHDFCPPGEAAGQCANPNPGEIGSLRGIAVSNSSRVYIADRRNNRVDVFEENGIFLFAFGWGVDTGANALQKCTAASTCQAGIAGSGAGQFNEPGRIAVDNVSGSDAVYVPEDKNHRVQKFGPEGELLGSVGSVGEGEGQFTSNIFAGVGPEGNLYVLDTPPLVSQKVKHRLQRFKPSLEEIGQCIALAEGGRVKGFTVETAGDFWVSSDPLPPNEVAGRGIRKYDPTCTLLKGPIDEEFETNYLAIGEGGKLFSEQREPREASGFSFQEITAYDTNGNHLRRYGYGLIPSPGEHKPEDLAFGQSGAFLSLGTIEVGVRRLTYPIPTPALPPSGPIVAPPSVEAPHVGSLRATVRGEVNPEGKATQVHAEYLTRAQFEGQGNSFEGSETKSTTPVSLGTEGFTLKGAQILVGCPNPAQEAGLPGNNCLTPETEYVFQIVGVNADGEGETAAGSFETASGLTFGDLYSTGVGTDTARLHGAVNPHEIPTSGYFEYVDDAHFQESGFEDAVDVPDVAHGQAPLDFGAGEEAAERSVAANPLAPGTLYHYRLVASNPLIEEPLRSEAQELRTFQPPAPGACPGNESFRIGAGTLLPDCRAYEMVSPLDKGGGGIALLKSPLLTPAVLEQSADSGDGLAYGSVRAFGGAPSAPWTSQYIARRIAGQEWRTHPISPPEGRPLFPVIARTDTEFKYFSPDLCQSWLTTYAEPPLGEGAVAGFSNLYRRNDSACGAESYEALAPLSKKGLPEGFRMELQGVSGDGARAILRASRKLAKGGTDGQSQLYESGPEGLSFVCVLPGGAPLAGPCSAGTGAASVETRSSSVTGAISADGSRIFWSAASSGSAPIYVRIDGSQTVAVSKAAEEEAGTSGSFFRAGSRNGELALFTTGSKLYEFDVDAKATEFLAEGVLGVVGMSEDGRRVYFGSTKKIAGSGQNSESREAVEGSPNLYLWEAGESGPPSTRFVATLDPEAEVVKPNRFGPLNPEPWLHTSRVTPDGAVAAFTSQASLTGYDNKDASTGEAAREVYLYEADSGKLICASCDPSGARPVSIALEDTHIAASIPGFENQMHAAHVLSDSGTRLYFESVDPLTPRDSNGHIDVYQWEAPGPDCSTDSPAYSPQDEGCVDPISSGQGLVDAHFVEATPDGSDVFVTTLASLLPQDYGLVDIYDARVNGGLPVPPISEPPCEGDSCHHPPAAPVQPTPSSSAYNAPPSKAVPSGRGCPKGRRPVTRKGKKRCVPRHRSHRHHHGRKGGNR